MTMKKDKIFEEIKKALPRARTGVPLKNFTTFKIGGPAKYFFRARNKNDLIKAIKAADKLKLPVFILGGGSNLLVSDKGFKGLVIKIQAASYKIQGNKVYAEAGADLTELVYATANAGLSGLEWSAGIPGITIGGAIYGHAQAFGAKMSDIVESAEAINLKTLEIKTFSKKQCQFSLKNSIFKKNKNLVIISALLEFKRKNPSQLKQQIKENISYREARHPICFPSAGSMFVNPEVIIKNRNLLMKFPELAEYNKKGVIPAGYLIVKCGLAGKKIGKAKISEKHGNFIVNLGGANPVRKSSDFSNGVSAKDVLALVNLAKKKVKKTFNIDLELEVQLMGFK